MLLAGGLLNGLELLGLLLQLTSQGIQVVCTARGIAFHPLYPSVPEAAQRNPALGELLALFDAVRGGSAREQALALILLEERLQP